MEGEDVCFCDADGLFLGRPLLCTAVLGSMASSCSIDMFKKREKEGEEERNGKKERNENILIANFEGCTRMPFY